VSPVKRTVGFAVLQQLLHHTLPLQTTADLLAGTQRCRTTCAQSVSTNRAKSQSQTSRVPNVWPCHWLSKRRSKTKKVTSQSWAPLDAHYGWASFVADRPSTNARQRISVDGPSPYHCLYATGHAFHWRRLAQNGTRGWPNGWGRIQTGLFGVARFQTGPFGLALPLKIQNKSNRVSWTRGRLGD